MMKRRIWFLSLILLTGLICSSIFAAETITITTYYPAPYGVYNELRSKKMAIGDNWYDGGTHPWEVVDGDGNPIDINADLVVEGNVGIGTTSPGEELHIESTNWALARFKYANVALGSTWDIGAGPIAFNIIDVESSTTPFRIGKGALDNSLVVGSAGNVGIGTTTPAEQLEVIGDIRTKAPIASGWGGTYLGLFTDYGSLPGYPTNTYATLKTDGSYIGFSAGGVYSAYMNSAGTWTAVSDRNKKENFINLNLQDVLAKIDQLPMYQWNFKGEDPSIKHIAPVAQDFYALFGLNGDNDKMISHIDPSGVALVGIKALSEKAKIQEQQIVKLQRDIEELRNGK
ncbi:MAG: tail fiber domain-containing protein [Candidatus Omnitrophica bacterium]|nr:tail fiber domain-containing protein [Candidatus Omnitrophota bacterium]